MTIEELATWAADLLTAYPASTPVFVGEFDDWGDLIEKTVRKFDRGNICWNDDRSGFVLGIEERKQ